MIIRHLEPLLGPAKTMPGQRPAQAPPDERTARHDLAAGEVPVDALGGGPSLADRPHDERLAARAVAGGEHARARSSSCRRPCGRCRAGRARSRTPSGSAGSGPRNPSASSTRSAARTCAVPGTSRIATLPSGPVCHDRSAISTPGHVLVAADEPAGRRGVAARVLAPQRLRLLLPVVQLVDLRPLGPRVVRRPLERRPAQQLELPHAPRALADRRPDAVRAGVAAADHERRPCPRRRSAPRRPPRRRAAAGCCRAGSSSRGGCRPARGRGSARSRATVAPVARTTASNSAWSSSAAMSAPTVTPVRKSMPSSSMRPTRRDDDVLVQLHVGDAVHQQAADAPGPLEHRHVVAGLVELVGGRRGPAGPEPMTATRLPGPRERRGRA